MVFRNQPSHTIENKPTLGIQHNSETQPNSLNSETQPTSMSALAFVKSDAYHKSKECMEFIQSKGMELPAGMTADFPVECFQALITKHKDEWDKEASEAELKVKAEQAWDEYKKQEIPEAEIKSKVEQTDGALWVKARGNNGLFINKPQLIADVCEFLEQKKSQTISDKLAELQPKKKSKGTGKRAPKREKDEFELKITNEGEEPQGHDYKFCLPLDENAVFLKDGKIKRVEGGKDIKPQTNKAVRKKTPFLSEGKCKCAISWDRASGSECLKKLGIKGAFYMGCDGDIVDERVGVCKKHLNSPNLKGSVYTTTYKSGLYKDYTYAQVLTILNEENETVMEGNTDWVEAKVGEKWKKDCVDFSDL